MCLWFRCVEKYLNMGEGGAQQSRREETMKGDKLQSTILSELEYFSEIKGAPLSL